MAIHTDEQPGLSERESARDTGAAVLKPDKHIRVLSIMEASSVTGPVKNLLQFAHSAATPAGDRPPIKMTIATFQRRGSEQPNRFVMAAETAGLPVDVIHERRAFDLSVVDQLRAVAAARKPDIIQTHNFKSHFLMRFAGLHKQYCWIAFHHGHTWTDFKNRIYNQLDRWSLPAAHAVVTVCRQFAEQLGRRGVKRDRIVVRHNMVKPFRAASPEQAVQLRNSLGIPAAALVILSVGRLSREKGFLDLVEAVSRVRAEATNRRIIFVIVGDGPDRAKITERAAELGVAERIILSGHQSDLARFYTMADMLVMPSHSEGSPNVLLEGMAAGLPIVATAVGGVPEIAQHGKTALLVDRENIAALASAIDQLASDLALRERLASAALEHSKAYDAAAYCSAMREVYERLFDSCVRHKDHC